MVFKYQVNKTGVTVKENTKSIARELYQILLDWEDDDVCSPHRVHDSLAGPMAKILERLYKVLNTLEAIDV